MGTRKITVGEIDYITPLRTYGPIITPTFYDESIVYQLVRRNYTVFEHSTEDATRGKKIKLTISNFNDPKRFHDESVKPMDRSNLTGVAAVGKATVVNPTAPSAPVDIPQEKTQDETPVAIPEGMTPAPEVKEIPAANPINNAGLTKKQRKELARKAAEEKAKAEAANTEANAEADEQATVEISTTEETISGPQSLKE